MMHPDPRLSARLHALASANMPTIHMGLERIFRLLELVGNPHVKLPPVIHVAGTNGKGSLLAYLRAMLEAEGKKVHRYTSPHLVQFNERIVLAGKEIEDAAIHALLDELEPACKACPVTGFEAFTALAFMAFSRTPTDVLLLETGLGGRLDATNVVAKPLLTAITPVSLDHMDFLGATVALIAGEKAGILKDGVPCVLGPQIPEAFDVIAGQAARLDVPLFAHDKDWHFTSHENGFVFTSGTYEAEFPLPALPGAHQIANAATAVACAYYAKALGIGESSMREGIRAAEWAARLQHITSGALLAYVPQSCQLWLDGGHNESAGREIAQWIDQQARPVTLICGMLKTKDVKAFLMPMAGMVRHLIAVPIEGEPLGRAPEGIASIAGQLGVESTYSSDIVTAIKAAAEDNKEGIILMLGSLSLAGNILWQNRGGA